MNLTIVTGFFASVHTALQNFFSAVDLAVLFPVLAALGLILFFVYYIRCMKPRKGTLDWIKRAQTKNDRFTFSAPLHKLERKDALPLLLLTVVYALTAFWNLGDFTAPQSFLSMSNGASVNFTAEHTVSISRVEYYTGLWTGTYELEYSADGVTWNTIELPQETGRLFYWLEPEEIPDVERSALYFRLSASCHDKMELGELALFDENGDLIPLTYDSDAVPLFDEQELVPAVPHWTNSAYFDEIYHARTGYEHVRGVYPYEVSHPPLGKLILSLGIQLFGMVPFGWRCMGTLFGVLMVPLLYVFLKNLFGKTAIALCGTALFTFDFMHLTQTRIATIDSYGVFFILAMFFFLYRYLALPPGTPFRKCAAPLFLSGLMFGLGAASKWIVFYGGAGMAILYFIALVWKCRDWPKQGAPSRAGWVVKTILFSIFSFVIVPLAIYVACYIPYVLSQGELTVQGLLETFWNNQKFMLTYHSGAMDTHPYSSRWYQWLLDIRPILYYMDNSVAGTTTRFAAFHNPLVSWFGLGALVIVAVQTVRRRCGKGLFILISYFAQLIPWIIIPRTTFAYHYFPSILFLCVALAYVFNDLAQSGRRWKGAVYSLTGCTVALYALFYPVLVGIQVPTWFMQCFIRWLPSWPF